MAKFKMELPTEIMNEIKFINDNSDEIFGEMTKAGAEAVADVVRNRVPLTEMRQNVKTSVIYKTPTDGGINTKVYIAGYIPFKGNRSYFGRRGAGGTTYYDYKGIPADFISKVFEYGTSERFTDLGQGRGKITKKPFFRRSFNKGMIEKAMLETQTKKSRGWLK